MHTSVLVISTRYYLLTAWRYTGLQATSIPLLRKLNAHRATLGTTPDVARATAGIHLLSVANPIENIPHKSGDQMG